MNICQRQITVAPTYANCSTEDTTPSATYAHCARLLCGQAAATASRRPDVPPELHYVLLNHGFRSAACHHTDYCCSGGIYFWNLHGSNYQFIKEVAIPLKKSYLFFLIKSCFITRWFKCRTNRISPSFDDFIYCKTLQCNSGILIYIHFEQHFNCSTAWQHTPCPIGRLFFSQEEPIARF